MNKDLPSPETLRNLLSYDPETGKLFWKARGYGRFDTRFAGREAFTAVDPRGYISGRVFNKTYTGHRVAWAVHYGAWPSGQIDHINHNRADNRLNNLRDVSIWENRVNATLQKNNKSGVAGVYWYARCGRWQAYIKVRGKRHHLGYFAEKFDAILTRLLAEKKHGFHINHGI